MMSEQHAKLANEHLLVERAYWPFIRGAQNENHDAMQEKLKVRLVTRAMVTGRCA